MSSRETVIELVNKLPEEMPLAEIAREQTRRRERIPAQDARKLVDAWAQSNSDAAIA